MAKFDTSKIEGFDGMSAEDQVKALLGADIPDAVDMSKYVSKETFDKKASEAAALSKQIKDKMTEDEKRKAEEEETIKSMKEELETLRHESAVTKYTANYVKLGMDEELAKSTAEAFIKGENDTVFANMQKFREDYRKSIEKELLDKTPKPGGNGGNGGKETDKAVEKAKELAKARTGVGKDINDIMGKYAHR